MEKEGGYPLSGDGFLGRAENYPLCKAIVDHNQQGIETRGNREIGDEVIGDLLEGMRCERLDQGEQRNGGMCVRLVLLAHGTAFNVFSHILCKAQPLEF